MHDGWRLEVAELRLAKRYEEALVMIRQAIAEGDMSARVMLATMGDKAGLSRPEVDTLIDEVEANLGPEDIETRLQLRGAYDVRFGNLPYDEKARRRFRHHLRAVELGANPIHTLALARIYVMGAPEVPPNETEAIRWYKHAIQQGSIELRTSCSGSTGTSKSETAAAQASLSLIRRENRASRLFLPRRPVAQ